jgi:hypothetical protein
MNCLNAGNVVSRSRTSALGVGFRGNRPIASSGRHPSIIARTLAAARGAVALRKLPASAVRAVSSTVYISRELSARALVRQSRVHPRGSRGSSRSRGTGVLASHATDAASGSGFLARRERRRHGAMRWE